MEAVCSSQTLVSTYKSTRRYSPEEQHGIFIAVRNSDSKYERCCFKTASVIMQILSIKSRIWTFILLRKRSKSDFLSDFHWVPFCASWNVMYFCVSTFSFLLRINQGVTSFDGVLVFEIGWVGTSFPEIDFQWTFARRMFVNRCTKCIEKQGDDVGK
jgi:hypothetical protein